MYGSEAHDVLEVESLGRIYVSLKELERFNLQKLWRLLAVGRMLSKLSNVKFF